MAQEHQQQPVESSGTSPRTQRMTAAESRAVIDLWQSERVEQTGLTDRPALPDVAEGLDITIEDVQRLLTEVRARRLEQECALTAEQELFEIRRHRAELRREQAELQRKQQADEQEQTVHVAYVMEKRAANPIGMIAGLIVFIFWICFIVSLAGNHGNGFAGGPPATSGCAIISPNGKPQPCPSDLQERILNGTK